MNEPGPVASDDRRLSRPVFISYATADRKPALSLCTAIERRGTKCWISARDVAPGENYQEEIVRAIRSARAMVLVFSEAANNSDEIKKEMSLASRYRVPVIAFRIEDIEPSDAFAYELSTRQWIDAFEGWDKSIDSLNQRLQQISGPASPTDPQAASFLRSRRSFLPGRGLLIATAVLLLLLVSGIAARFAFRPSQVPIHSMQVRLAGYQRLSPDLPASMPAAINDEVDAAFNDDGVVTVSRASAPPPGNTPAYALTGTVRRDGDQIKVTSRLTNERTGATLWTDSHDYSSAQEAHVPRLAGVSTSLPVRMGLFGASTYPGALSDQALTNYFQFWTNLANGQSNKALDSAHKLVAAVPDFSWGWSAVEIAALLAAREADTPTQAAPLHEDSLKAADKALSLDPRNSEALTFKSVLLPADAFVEREALFKKALDARPLACGCEHHMYGQLLLDVGRISDATSELRRAVAVLPLNPNTQFAYALSLILEGKADEARAPLDATADLSADPAVKDQLRQQMAPFTGDYAAAAKITANPAIQMSAPLRSAVEAGFQALASGNAQQKGDAVQKLAALPPADPQLTINLIALLGAPDVALRKATDYFDHGTRNSHYLFLPSMDSARRSPAFPAVAQKLGLMRYWKTTHTKPDVCSAGNPPAFCGMI